MTMLTETTKREIEAAVESALLTAPKDLPMMELARRIYASEPELIAKVQEAWILDKLIYQLRLCRHRVPSLELQETQLLLPGFERLPRRLSIEGRRTPLIEARLFELKQFRAILIRQRTARNDSKLAALDALIEMVTPYAREKRQITVGQVMAAEKGKQEGL
jgi:hypothetical protein